MDDYRGQGVPLVQIPSAVFRITKAWDFLSFIFVVKVVIISNLLYWVYIPFCEKYNLQGNNLQLLRMLRY